MAPQGLSTTDIRQRRARSSVVSVVVAESISTIGGRMAAFAIPWLVLVTTGSPLKVGLVAAAEMLPYVISGVLAAPLQDRLGARLTSIVADAASTVAMAAIILGHRMGFGALLVFVAIVGTLRAQADRSKNNIFKPLVEAAGTDFRRFASMREGALRSCNLIGASCAGIAVAVVGPVGALWFNAATFAISAAVVVTLVRAPSAVGDGPAATDGAAPPAAAPPVAEPYLQALRTGFAGYRGDRLIRAMTGMLFFTNMFNQASAVVFVPLWIMTGGHSPAVLGFVSGAFAVGAILGSVVFAALAPYLKPYRMLVLGYFIGGTPRLLILALSDDVAVVTTVMFVSGIAMCSVNPTIGAVVFQRIPGAMLARVGGIMAAVSFAGIPLGGLFAGGVVESAGFTNAVLLATVLYFAVILTPVVRHRIWRELNDTATRLRLDQDSLPVLYALGRTAVGPRISLRYVEGEWSVAARRGLRALAPRRPVPAKEALDALGQLTCAPLHHSVRAALHGVQVKTVQEASRLRAEIARLEEMLFDARLR